MADANNTPKVRDSIAKWEYPWNQVTQTAGGHETHMNSTPGEESSREFHPYGTYKEISKDGTIVQFNADKSYNYTAQGHSDTTEGTYDKLVLGGSRVNNQQGTHHETGESASHAFNESLLHAIKENKIVYGAKKEEMITDGSFKDINDGDHHTNVLGDKITFIDGTKYEQIGGEHGIHIPDGNMDTQIDGGKYRLKTGDTQRFDADSDITITSKTKITIIVGSSSIVITDGNITINTPELDVQAGAVNFTKS